MGEEVKEAGGKRRAQITKEEEGKSRRLQTIGHLQTSLIPFVCLKTCDLWYHLKPQNAKTIKVTQK